MNESEDVETGDLGLGKGLKPGAIEKDEDEDSNLKFTMLLHTPAGVRSRTSSVTGSDSDQHTSKFTNKFSDKLKWLKSKKGQQDMTDRGYDYDFPPYTEVPIGTSLTQQRQLFDQELQQLMKKNGITDAEGLFGTDKDSMEDYKNLDKKTAEKKLHSVEQEVLVLKHDLELCQSQLDTKYKAIKILQSQAYATQSEQMLTNRKVKIQNRQLQQEINQLQFQLDHQQTRLMNSQQGWLDKFDRVCQENTALMATVEAQAEEMRKLNAEKMGLTREREELLALLDIQERQRFESVHSPTSVSHSEETFYNFSSLQLAVLGSCHCRGTSSPEPCACALKAAQLQKELAAAKDDLREQKQKWRETQIVLDTYRMTFEEQLARNRGLIRKIAQLTAHPGSSSGRVDKARAAIKWVIKQLNDVSLNYQYYYDGKLGPYPLFVSPISPYTYPGYQDDSDKASSMKANSTKAGSTKASSTKYNSMDNKATSTKASSTKAGSTKAGSTMVGSTKAIKMKTFSTKAVSTKAMGTEASDDMPERPSKPAPAITPPPTFNSISQRQKEAATRQQLSRSSEKLGNRDSPSSELADRTRIGEENGATRGAVAEGGGDGAKGAGDGKSGAAGTDRGDVTKPNGCCTSSELLPGEAGDHRTSSPVWESISLPGSEGEPEKSEKSEKKEKSSERVPLSNGLIEDLEDKSEGDLIDMLLDTIYDKTEALLHQRLITRMLAEKTRELEATLARFTDADDVFQDSLQEEEGAGGE